MKNILALCLFVLLASNVDGQRLNVDSLVDVVNTQKLTPDEQLDLYVKICQGYYAAYNSDKTISFAEKGLALAENKKDKLKISRFNEYIGYGYADKSSYDTAMIYHQNALDAAIEAKDKKQELGMYVTISSLYASRSKFTQALEYSFKALPISESLDDKPRKASILSNIGKIYAILNVSDKAIFYLKQVEVIAEELNDDAKRISTDYELGKIYKDRGEYETALEYSQNALEISRRCNDKAYEAMSLQLLAEIHYRQNDNENALHYAESSVDICEKLGHKALYISSLNMLSNVLRKKKQFKESEKIASKAWDLDSANISVNIDNVSSNILYNIAYANIFLNNKDKAAIFLEKFRTTTSRYNNNNFHKTISEMEVKYETEKKELRISSLEKERKLYIWLGVAGILLVLSLGISLWLKVRNSKKEKLVVASKAVQEGEMGERERIASELHDRLLGTLSAVRSEINNTSTSDKLDSCIEEIRRISSNLMPVPLRYGIKTAIEDFTAQFPNVYFHFFGKEKRIEKRLEFAVYCCVNELVTNSIRHSDAKNINVQLVQGEDQISLTIQDDGCGFDERTVKKGIGLKSIQNRVASCNGKMYVFSSPGKGTETIIQINI